MNRITAVLLATATFVAGGCAMFTFDDGLQDTTLARSTTWGPGDPWANRVTTTQLDNRDKSLENHVNADYVRHDFTVQLFQVGLITLNTAFTSAKFTQGAKVHVEMTIVTASAGVAGTRISVTPTGLPDGQPNGSVFNGASMGTFIYYQPAGITAIAGSCTWDGVVLLFYPGGLHSAGALGADPSFAVASGDTLIVNFSYLPAP